MLYVFTSIENDVTPMDLSAAVRNMNLEKARYLPIPHNEFWSERKLYDEVRSRFIEIYKLYGNDCYTFTMRTVELDMIRALVKKCVISCGVNVVVFEAGGDILGSCEIDKNGMSDVFRDFGVFETPTDILMELF